MRVSNRDYPQASLWCELSTGVGCVGDKCSSHEDHQCMSIRSMTVLTSPSQSEGTVQQPRADACVWIRKGCYVRVDSPDAFTTIWDSWATVAQARLLAVCVGAKRQAVLVGNSALVARSIPLWEANPDVVAWFGVRHGKRRLPPVRTMVATVPPVYVYATTSRPSEDALEIIDGLRCESVIDAVVRMACHSEALSAFVAACMVLRHESGFSKFAQDEARCLAEMTKDTMKVRLIERRRAATCIPYKRAERIIDAADPGCDNPAEAALLWVLKSVSAFEVVTQFEIVVNGHRYFADIAIPGLMIIFEFDGIGKLGKDDAEFARAKRDWIQRENDLRRAGWTIYRVSWRDYEDFAALRAWAIKLLRPHQVAIPEHAEALWALPTEACDGPSRRFHTRSR